MDLRQTAFGRGKRITDIRFAARSGRKRSVLFGVGDGNKRTSVRGKCRRQEATKASGALSLYSLRKSAIGTRSTELHEEQCDRKAECAADHGFPGARWQYRIAERDRRRLKRAPTPRYDFRKASRSALIISACVVGMPCGNSLYIFSVPFLSNFADKGPASAYGTI